METNASPIFNQQVARRAEPARPVYVYNLPKSVQDATGLHTIGLVELNAEEELNAGRRARAEPLRSLTEQAREALRQVDGQPVTTADTSIDKAWEQLGAKGRSLVIHAFMRLHQPTDAETVDFLQGCRVTSG